MRVELHDDDQVSGGCRAEGVRSKLTHREKAETTVRYRWSTMLDTDYPMNPLLTKDLTPGTTSKPPFQLIAQWHADEETDLFGDESPPVSIIIYRGFFTLDMYTVVLVDGSRELVRVNVDGEHPDGLPIAPITTGQWHHFEVTIRWSGTAGWVSVLHWTDEAHAVSVNAPTLYPSKADPEVAGTAYFKLGLYRGGSADGHALPTTDHDPHRPPQRLGTTVDGGRIGYILFHDEISKYELPGSTGPV